jgi:hypothetical protein
MVRILKLLPGSMHDEIQCEIHHVYLRHEEEDRRVNDDNPLGTDPDYEALSYPWGDQTA